jgi:hypothetical protein
MSLDSHLIHTCSIQNPAAGSTNVYNNASKGYAAAITGVRCRLVETRELVQSDEVTEGIIQSVYKLMVRGDVNLQENAKISNLTLEDGTVINDTFQVIDLLIRRGRNAHHKTATLERLS